MQHTGRWLGLASFCLAAWSRIVAAQEPGDGPVPLREGPIAVRLVERGAWLVDGFEGTEPDPKSWRVWHSDPTRTTLAVRDGRFQLTAEGEIGHNGLWHLNSVKTKDVVLVGRMDVRSEGPDPHTLALHLCGGDGARSPDHWTEITLRDEGARGRFGYWSTEPGGVFVYDSASEVVLERGTDDGFLAKVEMDGGTNVATTWVHDGERWVQVGPAVAMTLRTVHCEVKFRGGAPPRGPAPTTSRAWFDDVRMYPRPQSNPVGIRLVREDGSQIWSRGAGEAWPPKIRVGDGPERSIEDLGVELRTEDGQTLVAAMQSQNMGFYMLSLERAPWDVYPVAAKLRLTLDGRQLGQEVLIPRDGLSGLYPDDVWDVVVR
jgi:hypothetical protein